MYTILSMKFLIKFLIGCFHHFGVKSWQDWFIYLFNLSSCTFLRAFLNFLNRLNYRLNSFGEVGASIERRLSNVKRNAWTVCWRKNLRNLPLTAEQKRRWIFICVHRRRIIGSAWKRKCTCMSEVIAQGNRNTHLRSNSFEMIIISREIEVRW